MTTTVLFLCPHGAAKSTSSVAFLRREAARRDLDLVVFNAGTEPDLQVNPIVRKRLDHEGLSYDSPRLVTDQDLQAADVIVNYGCSAKDLQTNRSIHEWRVPNFGDDPVAAFSAIEAHVVGLATGLASAGTPAPKNR